MRLSTMLALAGAAATASARTAYLVSPQVINTTTYLREIDNNAKLAGDYDAVNIACAWPPGERCGACAAAGAGELSAGLQAMPAAPRPRRRGRRP